MTARPWGSRTAAALVAATGTSDAAQAIKQLAARLLDEAAFRKPPYAPEVLASMQNIKDVRLVEMESAARLVPDGECWYVHVNRRHSRAKRNFSVDHEVTHTLLPTYSRELIDDAVTGRFEQSPEDEWLCDIGASTLLLDERVVRPMANDFPPSLAGLKAIADTFDASLEATGRKIADVDVWRCAFVFWEEQFTAAQRNAAGQPTFAGWEDAADPVPKLRVARFYASKGFQHLLGIKRAAPEGSLVAECFRTRANVAGVELFDFGRQVVRIHAEHWYSPYTSEDGLRPRVMSLFLDN